MIIKLVTTIFVLFALNNSRKADGSISELSYNNLMADLKGAETTERLGE